MKLRISSILMLMLLIGILVTSALFLNINFESAYEEKKEFLNFISDSIVKSLEQDKISENSFIESSKNTREFDVYIFDADKNPAFENKNIESLSKKDTEKILESDFFEVKGKRIGENSLFKTTKLSTGNYLVVSTSTRYLFKDSIKITFPILILILFGIFFASYISKYLVEDFVGNIEEKVSNYSTNKFNLKVKYPELYPFVRIIKDQRDNINYQIRELESQANTIDTIISNMQEGMILTDRSLKILSVNKAAIEILDSEFDKDSVMKLNLRAWIRDKNFLEKLDQLKKHDEENISFDYNINEKTINVIMNLVKRDEKPIGYIILFVDKTAEKLVEKQRAEFSANVSHELKTPLTSINGYAEMIKSGMVRDEDIPKFGNVIFEEGNRLLAMIDDIIKLSKLDETSIELDKKEQIINEVLEASIKTVHNKTYEKNVEIIFNPREEFVYKFNYQLFMELFTNLIDNAVKYNVQDGKVFVDLQKIGGNLVIEIKDTGIGIPKSEQKRIFERFYTVDKSHKRKDSSGLGLAITKHIVKLYNGSIDLESEPGKGTKFTIKFPTEN